MSSEVEEQGETAAYSVQSSAEDSAVLEQPRPLGMINQGVMSTADLRPIMMNGERKVLSESSEPLSDVSYSKSSSVSRPSEEASFGDEAGPYRFCRNDFKNLFRLDTLGRKHKVKEWGGVRGICNGIRTDPHYGLELEDLEDRVVVYGNNDNPIPAQPSFGGLFFEALMDRTLVVLAFAAVVSLALGLTLDDTGAECVPEDDPEFCRYWEVPDMDWMLKELNDSAPDDKLPPNYEKPFWPHAVKDPPPAFENEPVDGGPPVADASILREPESARGGAEGERAESSDDVVEKGVVDVGEEADISNAVGGPDASHNNNDDDENNNINNHVNAADAAADPEGWKAEYYAEFKRGGTASATVSSSSDDTTSTSDFTTMTTAAAPPPPPPSPYRWVVKKGEEEVNLGWVEGVAIWCAIVAVVAFATANNYYQGSLFHQMHKKKEDRRSIVIRRGRTAKIQTADLMVGDVIRIHSGDLLPCDGIIVESQGLKIVEFDVFGDSEEMIKGATLEHDCFVESGSHVSAGRGAFVALAVGPHSIRGQRILRTGFSQKDTPLQDELEVLADAIGKIGVFAALLLFVALTCRLFVVRLVNQQTIVASKVLPIIVEYIIIAIAIVAVAVPEGLPLAVTLSLAYSMGRMFNDKLLVKDLPAVENMARVTTVCVDKTAVITENRKEVVAGWMGGYNIRNEGRHKNLDTIKIKWSLYLTYDTDRSTWMFDSPTELLKQIVAVNSNSFQVEMWADDGEVDPLELVDSYDSSGSSSVLSSESERDEADQAQRVADKRAGAAAGGGPGGGPGGGGAKGGKKAKSAKGGSGEGSGSDGRVKPGSALESGGDGELDEYESEDEGWGEGEGEGGDEYDEDEEDSEEEEEFQIPDEFSEQQEEGGVRINIGNPTANSSQPKRPRRSKPRYKLTGDLEGVPVSVVEDSVAGEPLWKLADDPLAAAVEAGAIDGHEAEWWDDVYVAGLADLSDEDESDDDSDTSSDSSRDAGAGVWGTSFLRNLRPSALTKKAPKYKPVPASPSLSTDLSNMEQQSEEEESEAVTEEVSEAVSEELSAEASEEVSDEASEEVSAEASEEGSEAESGEASVAGGYGRYSGDDESWAEGAGKGNTDDNNENSVRFKQHSSMEDTDPGDLRGTPNNIGPYSPRNGSSEETELSHAEQRYLEELEQARIPKIPVDPPKMWVGNALDLGLLRFVKRLLVSGTSEEFDLQYFRDSLRDRIVRVYAFSVVKKKMGVILRRPEGGFRYLVKGASEEVVTFCDKIMNKHRMIEKLGQNWQLFLGVKIHDLAREDLHTVGVAFADFDTEPAEGWEHPPKVPLTCLGVLGMRDPIRENAAEAVALCKRAGVTVRMVTGDNITTAKSVAYRVGILTEEGFALEGAEVRGMSHEELASVADKLEIIARALPTDKFLLVDHLMKEHDHIVAVTGDDPKDTRVIGNADVGLAMKDSSAEMTKEGADLVLLDDQISTIVSGLKWGRNIYDSVRKFLQYQLTINIVVVTLTFVGTLRDGDGVAPLNAVHLLWVNLIMDTLAALALATEYPANSLLNRQPIRDNKIITKSMWLSVLTQYVYQMAVLIFLLEYGTLLFTYRAAELVEEREYYRANPDDFPKNREERRDEIWHYSTKHRTIIFTTFVLMQVLNLLNCRKISQEENIFDGIWRSYPLMFVGVFICVIQAVIVQYGGIWLSTVPLTRGEWIICLIAASGVLVVGFLTRLVPMSTEDKGEDESKVSDEHVLWRWIRSHHRTQERVVEAFLHATHLLGDILSTQEGTTFSEGGTTTGDDGEGGDGFDDEAEGRGVPAKGEVSVLSDFSGTSERSFVGSEEESGGLERESGEASVVSSVASGEDDEVSHQSGASSY